MFFSCSVLLNSLICILYILFCFYFRRLWICVPESRTSTQFCSRSASFTLVSRSVVNLALKGGTITIPSAPETSPSQQTSYSTTWKPTPKYLSHIYNFLFTVLTGVKLLIVFYHYFFKLCKFLLIAVFAQVSLSDMDTELLYSVSNYFCSTIVCKKCSYSSLFLLL